MPVKRDDASTALAILKRLSEESPKDSPLGTAANRVANIFQSRLFNALLDIQDYYELQFNSKSEKNQEAQFKTFSIELIRNASGLGFSITGGLDSPVTPGDIHIYISKIIPDGAADIQGELAPGDAILAINGVDCRTVTHGSCVDILRNAGSIVKILVGRKGLLSSSDMDSDQLNGQLTSSNSTLNDGVDILSVQLIKNKSGLGFSIAGGVGNEHIEGNDGIFVTKIISGGAAYMDGRLQAGDRILAVDNEVLNSVTHEEAVYKLTQTGAVVNLKIARGSQIRHELSDERNQENTSESSSSIGSLQETVKSQNILNVSHVSENGVPSGSAAASALASGCEVIDASQDSTNPTRTVNLSRGKNGFGFNIVGGEQGDQPGIFVSFVLCGGPADLSQNILKGDRIISVNGQSIEDANHDQAAEALKNAGESVTLVVQQEPLLFETFEERINELREQMLSASLVGGLQTTQLKELTVRALFDYTAVRDSGLPSKGLSFRFGDILHVTNASDSEWWQANMINNPMERGCIPSKTRVERKERLRMKQVKFRRPDDGTEVRKSRGRLNLIQKLDGFSFMKSKENVFREETPSTSSESDVELADDWVLSYEPVEMVEVDTPRPVVIFGPLKDRVSDELIKSDEKRFQQAIPHTTRPKRDNEVEGRDYYFVTKTEMSEQIEKQQFIEAGQFSDNLYGTSIKAVLDVANQNKHCILDVSGGALRRLTAANLPPIAIYIKPRSVESLMQMNKRLNEDNASLIIKQCQRLEADYAEQFTAVVQAEDGEDLVIQQVFEIISQHQGESHWLPTGDKL